MPRKILQDIVPPDKKSIRHIPLPANRKPVLMERVLPEEKEKKEEPKPKRERQKRSFRLSRWYISIGAVTLFLVAFFLLSWYMASATITIQPKQITAPVQTSFEAKLQEGSALVYTLIVATSSASEVIPTNKEENVQRKASGQIVVYNNFSSESQRLIKNTRFEASDGRIYRIDSSVIVPGQKVEGGKKVPGSITVTVYADVAGPEYNLPLSQLKGDFTIPGFKGSPRFQSFYARQKTDIAGGFSGRARVVDDAALDAVEKKLKTKLTDENWSALSSSLPANYMLFKTLSSVDFSVLTKDNPDGDGILIEVIALGKAAAFDKGTLSGLLAQKSIPGYNTTEPISIENMSEIKITQADSNPSLGEKSGLQLRAEGNAHFVWQFDQNAITQGVLGRSKGDTESILKNFTAIDRASVVIKPSWRNKYPTSAKRVHVEIKLD